MTSAHGLLGIESRWAAAGLTGPTLMRGVVNHVRMIRPATRLWLDTIMPITVLTVASGGRPPLRETVLFILSMNLIHIGATIFNDLSDIETDRHSTEVLRRTRPIARGAISARLATAEAVVAVVVGTALSYAVAVWFGVAITVLALLTLLHELPPIHVQSRTVVTQLYTTLGLAGLIFAIEFVVPEPPLRTAIPYGLFVVVYLGLCETLVKDVRDVDNDTIGGKLTTSVRYGADRATTAAGVAYLVALVCWVVFVSGIQPLPWSLVAVTVVIGAWAGFVLWAGRQLRRQFDKATCIVLHRGSEIVFTLANLSILLVLW